ncbi:MAG: hypothetical protein AAB656_04465 [Patescibacteria group bacterium]
MKKEFGQDTTTAEEQGTRLLKFFELLIDIDRRHQSKTNNNKK